MTPNGMGGLHDALADDQAIADANRLLTWMDDPIEAAAIAIQCGCEMQFGFPVFPWSALPDEQRERFREIARSIAGELLLGTREDRAAIGRALQLARIVNRWRMTKLGDRNADAVVAAAASVLTDEDLSALARLAEGAGS